MDGHKLLTTKFSRWSGGSDSFTEFEADKELIVGKDVSERIALDMVKHGYARDLTAEAAAPAPEAPEQPADEEQAPDQPPADEPAPEAPEAPEGEPEAEDKADHEKPNPADLNKADAPVEENK